MVTRRSRRWCHRARGLRILPGRCYRFIYQATGSNGANTVDREIVQVLIHVCRCTTVMPRVHVRKSMDCSLSIREPRVENSGRSKPMEESERDSMERSSSKKILFLRIYFWKRYFVFKNQTIEYVAFTSVVIDSTINL